MESIIGQARATRAYAAQVREEAIRLRRQSVTLIGRAESERERTWNLKLRFHQALEKGMDLPRTRRFFVAARSLRLGGRLLFRCDVVTEAELGTDPAPLIARGYLLEGDYRLCDLPSPRGFWSDGFGLE